MINVRSGRLGYRYRPQPKAGTLAGACDSIPLYVPKSADGYTLSELGASGTGATTVANGYIRYTINGGPNQGQIGDGSNTFGMQFDPDGNGNYGSDDYIRPGTPHETYGFLINGTTWLGGDNVGNGNFSQGGTTAMWNKSTAGLGHVVCMRGSESLGFAVVQYQTYAGESLIRMKMSYTNTTGSAVTLKAIRGCDPDVGAIQYSIYNTTNYRGYGSISASDIVVAQESNTGKPISLYIPGNGYTHNTAILSAWPSVAVDTMLSGQNDGNGDYSIYGAWNIGSVPAGATVAVCCYYVIGTNIDAAVGSIF